MTWFDLVLFVGFRRPGSLLGLDFMVDRVRLIGVWGKEPEPI